MARKSYYSFRNFQLERLKENFLSYEILFLFTETFKSLFNLFREKACFERKQQERDNDHDHDHDHDHDYNEDQRWRPRWRNEIVRLRNGENGSRTNPVLTQRICSCTYLLFNPPECSGIEMTASLSRISNPRLKTQF